MNVFIAGPRAVRTLNNEITSIISRIVSKNMNVLIGDAAGVDSLVQGHLSKIRYSNVTVYASKGIVRNNIGSWPVQSIDVSSNLKGFNFYAQKDIMMATDAENGFMIWDGKSKGTLNNIINLTSQGKQVVIYLIPMQKEYCIDKLESIQKLSELMGAKTLSLFNELLYYSQPVQQLALL